MSKLINELFKRNNICKDCNSRMEIEKVQLTGPYAGGALGAWATRTNTTYQQLLTHTHRHRHQWYARYSSKHLEDRTKVNYHILNISSKLLKTLCTFAFLYTSQSGILTVQCSDSAALCIHPLQASTSSQYIINADEFVISQTMPRNSSATLSPVLETYQNVAGHAF